ncbi:MAG: bacillithiol biosynthesis deacetylase BshB1 [Myxococcales bacterium]|nr:bacillithiol biosynthesis deacetylase BshB1 [Myxococcales bacterium]MCB9643894.1 bacillithiol biosynthesis deacetylase BshB1 [Myxococcales bacterium]
MSQATSLDLLAVGPHPDDVELFCGGLLIKMAQQGYRTGILDLSHGELASNGDPETRAQEAAEAARVMGLSHRENLGLPDGAILPWSPEEASEASTDSPTARIAEVIRRLRPALLIIPWKEGRHPDHRNTSALLSRAIFLAGLRKYQTSSNLPAFAPTQTLFYAMRHSFTPSFLVDISAVAALKTQAILCHASQVTPQGGTTTLVGSPRALSSIDARDRYYGAMLGVEHAESFLCENTLGIDDPIAHFNQYADRRPHFFEKRS